MTFELLNLSTKACPGPQVLHGMARHVDECVAPPAKEFMTPPVKGIMASPVKEHMVSPLDFCSANPVRVSKSHGLTVVRPHKYFLTLRKILRFACSN